MIRTIKEREREKNRIMASIFRSILSVCVVKMSLVLFTLYKHNSLQYCKPFESWCKAFKQFINILQFFCLQIHRLRAQTIAILLPNTVPGFVYRRTWPFEWNIVSNIRRENENRFQAIFSYSNDFEAIRKMLHCFFISYLYEWRNPLNTLCVLYIHTRTAFT